MKKKHTQFNFKDRSTVFFSNFDKNKLGKTRRHHWKERLKINTINLQNLKVIGLKWAKV